MVEPFKELAEQAAISLDTANMQWDEGKRNYATEQYMMARTEALVSIALAMAELVEDGGKLDALVVEADRLRRS